MSSKLLENKTAWVVGAAGAIGAATCARFAEEGARIVLSGRKEKSLEEVAERLPGGKEATFVQPMDIVDRAQVEAAADAAVSRFGGVDVLVNSTTLPMFDDYARLADKDWMGVMDAKFLGYMRTARAILPHMAKRGSGSIINVSGRGGHQPDIPAHLAGSCANGAVNTLTKGLANIYGAKGIRINAISPGPVRSPRYDRIAAADRDLASNKTADVQPSAVGVLGPQAELEDIANAALYLGSDLGKYLTGIVLQVDGGGTKAL